MSRCLLSSAYLPPIEYFIILGRYNEIRIEQHEHYLKQTYRNRCRIAGPNRVQELIVPVDKQGALKVLLRDLTISYAEPWQVLQWRSLQTAYSNSPFFLYYRDELEVFYQKKYTFLLDFNLEILSLLFRWLRIDKPLMLTDEFIPLSNDRDDFRYRIHPKKEVTASCNPYHQVFRERHGFIPNLSIIDLLFNEGPGSREWLGL